MSVFFYLRIILLLPITGKMVIKHNVILKQVTSVTASLSGKNEEKKLQHFYIAEEQSIYLLNHKDATKLKQWVELCQKQLKQLGYSKIALLGKGAYGYVFSAKNIAGDDVVFKFSRSNLPHQVQDRLSEEAEIQRKLNHRQIQKRK